MSVNNSHDSPQPVGELQPQFSSSGAAATEWSKAIEELQKAEVYWLSTVRPEGQPHVTPLVAVWLNGTLYFCTGPSEQKAKNLAQNAHCIITTGCNSLSDSLDIVIEGEAARVVDKARFQQLADKFTAKYEAPFNFSAGDLEELVVYEVAPVTAFAFGRGAAFSQTRWRFKETKR